jgi:hypothetical protein
VKSIDDLRPNAAVVYLAIRELVEPTHTADRSDAKSKMALFTEDKILLPVFGAGHRLRVYAGHAIVNKNALSVMASTS